MLSYMCPYDCIRVSLCFMVLAGLICTPAVPRRDVDICFCSDAVSRKSGEEEEEEAPSRKPKPKQVALKRMRVLLGRKKENDKEDEEEDDKEDGEEDEEEQDNKGGEEEDKEEGEDDKEVE